MYIYLHSKHGFTLEFTSYSFYIWFMATSYDTYMMWAHLMMPNLDLEIL